MIQKFDTCSICNKQKSRTKNERCRKCAAADPTAREKRSTKTKELWQNPSHRLVISKKNKETWQDPEYRQRMSEAAQSRWKDQEYRERVVSSIASSLADPETKARHKSGISRGLNTQESKTIRSSIHKEVANRPDVKEKRSIANREQANRPEVRIKKSIAMGGDGDIERIERRRQMINEYRKSPAGQWSLSVRKRDEHQCQHCGSRKMLHAHHIKPRSLYPELALEITNGITLCSLCHAQEHRKLNNQ